MRTFNRKQKTFFAILALFSFSVLSAAWYYLGQNGVGASELESEWGKPVWQTSKNWDIDFDGKEEYLELASYKKDDVHISYLITKKGFMSYKNIELSGFEEDLAFCPLPSFSDASSNYYLCIFGEVGAHSQNIQILQWPGLTSVNFEKGGVVSPNMISDLPNFDFDYSNREKTAMFFDYRNYNLDPLKDVIREHYTLDSRQIFRYDGVEMINAEGLIK